MYSPKIFELGKQVKKFKGGKPRESKNQRKIRSWCIFLMSGNHNIEKGADKEATVPFSLYAVK